MSRPLAVDLCCGMGGWTEGLQDVGWNTLGFDLVALPEYRWPLALQDIATLDGRRFRRAGVRLIVASPPCTEFSNRDNPFNGGRPPGMPDMSLVNACFRLAREAGCPLVLENVRGARPYLGKTPYRYQTWWLWGDGVPPLLPPTRYDGKKRLGTSNWDGRGAQRRARIPLELARWVGDYHR